MTVRVPRGSVPAGAGRTPRGQASTSPYTGATEVVTARFAERLHTMHPLLLVVAFTHNGPVQVIDEGLVTFDRE